MRSATRRRFDLLDEVDAVRVIGSVEKGAEGLESGHPKSPPLGHSLSKRGHQRGHQGGILTDSKGSRLEGSALTN